LAHVLAEEGALMSKYVGVTFVLLCIYYVVHLVGCNKWTLGSTSLYKFLCFQTELGNCNYVALDAAYFVRRNLSLYNFCVK